MKNKIRIIMDDHKSNIIIFKYIVFLSRMN